MQNHFKPVRSYEIMHFGFRPCQRLHAAPDCFRIDRPDTAHTVQNPLPPFLQRHGFVRFKAVYPFPNTDAPCTGLHKVF